ncbi:hypothetical protein GLYMA_02G008702v4 [Glycine max]|nr:hypothetical protein GLYMA_02G008702v4 [Glycine max]KAH1058171.1 hypothetical protein GYH30_002636 [Glycine max]
MTRPSSTLTLLVDLSLVALMVMLVLPEERLSLILIVAGVHMEVVLSQERTLLRLIEVVPMLQGSSKEYCSKWTCTQVHCSSFLCHWCS